MKTHRSLSCIKALAFTVLLAAKAFAATYYVDFEGGKDTAAGTSTTSAWQHCPGDNDATGKAASKRLGPGDTVIFKGGVTYRGSIMVSDSGTETAPITLDGNSDGKFGVGRAIISGAEPIPGLKLCATAAEAGGNPHFAKIYTASLPPGTDWKAVNLVQAGSHLLAIAEEPNPSDPFFQENPNEFHDAGQPIRENSSVRIAPVGMTENATRPLIAMIDGGQLSGVINNLEGGAIKVTWPNAVTLSALGISPQPNYTWPKDIEVYADKTLVLKTTLTSPMDGAKKPVEQNLTFPKPITTSEIEIRFLTAQSQPAWGAIAKLAGYDESGNDIMATSREFFLQDPKVLSQTDPHSWDGASLALHVKPNVVIYTDILGFDPSRQELAIQPFTNAQYPSIRYAIVNALRALDTPGEYVVETSAAGSTLYVWPLPDMPVAMERSMLSSGVVINNASHVRIQGLQIQQFAGERNGSALDATGQGAEDIQIVDLIVRFNRSLFAGAIAVNRYTGVTIENCVVTENAGHMKGILVRNSQNVLVRNCKVIRGSGTAIDFYTCTNGAILDCEITGNKGPHANGLTFYVGCSDILVEGNRVSDGNVGITFQQGKGLIVRNNFIQSGEGPAIGVWDGKPFTDLLFANNIILASEAEAPSLYGGNEGTANLYVVNNIMTPPGGNIMQKGTFENNVVITDGMAMTAEILPGNNLFVSDRNLIFRDPVKDFQPAAGSPALGAGKALALAGSQDLRGAPRMQGRDIGAYSAEGTPAGTPRPWADSSLADFQFPAFTPPAIPGSAPNFPHVSNQPEITLPALSYSAQGGGEVLRRDAGAYFAKWDTAGHWIEWTFDAPSDGNYELCLIEASALPAKRSFQINEQPIPELQDVVMSVSGNWKKFIPQNLKAPIALKAGKNVLRVTNPDATALNFRELTFSKIK